MASVKDSEVGQGNVVVEALMETLVDPRLPRGIFRDFSPSEESQKSVAKQMHAVVILFNYYHRRRELDIPFLSLAPFCRMAQLLRPSLGVFLKFITEREMGEELNNPCNQLSITEKAIYDACNVVKSLDASNAVPVTELPISKVVVLLIDSKGENCFLDFGAVTEGVWSLVEREIDSSIILDELAEQNTRKRRKTDNELMLDYDSKLLLIAYEAVKDATKISSSDLVVLKADVVHSMSKEKSAAKFYMMRYSHSFGIRQRISLKEIVESLQSPLVEKDGISWTTTKCVEFFHLLPYVEFISSWLSRREETNSPFINDDDAQITPESSRKETSSPFLKGDGVQITKKNDEKETPRSKELDQVEINSQNKRKLSSTGRIASPVNVVQSANEQHGNSEEVFNDIRELLFDNPGRKKKGSEIISFAKSDKVSEIDQRDFLSDPPRGQPQTRVGEDSSIQRTCVSSRTRSSLKAKEIKSVSTTPARRTRRKHALSPQHDVHGPEDYADLLVETSEPSKTKDRLSRDEKVTADNGEANISCKQAKEDPLVESEAINDSLDRDERKTAENRIAAKENPVAKSKAINDSLDRGERKTAEKGDTITPRKRKGIAAKTFSAVESEAINERKTAENGIAAKENPVANSEAINDSLDKGERKTAEKGDIITPRRRRGIAAKKYSLAESEAINKSKTAEHGIAAKDNPVAESEAINNRMDSTAEIGGTTTPCNQSGIAAEENPPSKHEALRNTGAEKGILSTTEMDVVALLRRKVQEVVSGGHRMLEDGAVYEGIIDRINRGGEMDLASLCLRHIVNGNYDLLLNEVQVQAKVHQPIEDRSQTKYKLVLPGNSSCQDLELICISNNLGLPRYVITPYHVDPSKFEGEVMVKINGICLREKGDPKSSPREAKESCAAELIARIKDRFS